MFVTNESSLEVVEEAFRRGAHGYVYKPRVQRDVLPVLDAIIRGRRFVSGGLERIAQGDGLASHRHEVVFCRATRCCSARSPIPCRRTPEGKRRRRGGDRGARAKPRIQPGSVPRGRRPGGPTATLFPRERQRTALEGDGQRAPGPVAVSGRRGDLLTDVTRRATGRRAGSRPAGRPFHLLDARIRGSRHSNGTSVGTRSR